MHVLLFWMLHTVVLSFCILVPRELFSLGKLSQATSKWHKAHFKRQSNENEQNRKQGAWLFTQEIIFFSYLPSSDIYYHNRQTNFLKFGFSLRMKISVDQHYFVEKPFSQSKTRSIIFVNDRLYIKQTFWLIFRPDLSHLCSNAWNN